MDILIDAFSSTQVTVQPNSTAAQHPHFSLYKQKREFPSQEERRKRFLAAQKSKRYDFASHARNLATNEWDVDDENEEDDSGEKENEDMEWQAAAPKKPPRSYRNQVMLSEWLVEIPEDFENEWYLMPCPVGKRCLVVSSKGCTKAYSRSGYMLNSFPSHLPGGNRSDHRKHGSQMFSYCLLDCVYNEVEKTYYVLDVMCWNSHPCFDSETSFRFYWMHEKMKEYPTLNEISKINPYKFIPLMYFACDHDTIKKTLWAPLPFKPKLDGLLFYHKQTHYTSGSTPLVGWLKAYMVPEILNIEIPDSLNEDKPASYISMKQHVPEAFTKNEARKQEDKTMLCDET